MKQCDLLRGKQNGAHCHFSLRQSTSQSTGVDWWYLFQPVKRKEATDFEEEERSWVSRMIEGIQSTGTFQKKHWYPFFLKY